MTLQDEIRFVRGIGPKKAQALERLGIRTLYDALECYPRGYEDRTVVTRIRDLSEGESFCIHAVLAAPLKTAHIRRGMDVSNGMAYDETGAVQYPLANSVTFELDTIHSVLVAASNGFLWAGLFFALFAALMLANFIAVSINYKRQEIGILRAIGSRSNDVFRIFFAESFIIAMINFVLSSVGVGIVTAAINRVIRTQLNVLVTVLGFGARQIVLLLAVSLLVAALASFFPVRRIAAKRPIDAIRGK